MKKVVTVFLDGAPRSVAAGITVRGLLTPEEIDQVRRGELAVLDGRGQERGLDGALLDGTRLVRRPADRGKNG